MQNWDLVVIGAGIAGLSAIKGFRSIHPNSKILLIDREDQLPYKRTKLSKILKAGDDINQFLLEPESYFDDIDFMLEVQVDEINTSAKTITLDTDETFSYKKLIIATGSKPSIPDSAKLHKNEVVVMRSARDLELIRNRLPLTQKVLVVGMGVLGIEIAEQMKLLGKSVICVGSGALILKKELTERSSEIIEGVLSKKGIELRFMDEIIALGRRNGKIHVSFLQSKEAEFDLVVWATGTGPNIELAKIAGLKTKNGILVNAHMETSIKDIFAAGDCVEDEKGHVTHLWHESEAQGHLAGLNAAGKNDSWQNTGFRLKCEVFGTYLWSLNKPAQVENFEFIEFEQNGIYTGIYLLDGKIKGMVMVGDKSRNDVYETAVYEEWSLKTFSERLR